MTARCLLCSCQQTPSYTSLVSIGERAALLTYSMAYNYNRGTAQSQLFGMRIDVQGAAAGGGAELGSGSANADRPLKSDERVSDATFAARWGVQTHWSQEPLAPGRMANLSRAFGKPPRYCWHLGRILDYCWRLGRHRSHRLHVDAGREDAW